MTPNERTFAIRPPHPGSAVLLASGDWLALTLNVASGMEAYWLVAVGCALLTAFGITAVEATLSRDAVRVALIKGGVLSALIVLPFPVAGSITALGLSVWWCAHYFYRRRHGPGDLAKSTTPADLTR